MCAWLFVYILNTFLGGVCIDIYARAAGIIINARAHTRFAWFVFVAVVLVTLWVVSRLPHAKFVNCGLTLMLLLCLEAKIYTYIPLTMFVIYIRTYWWVTTTTRPLQLLD